VECCISKTNIILEQSYSGFLIAVALEKLLLDDGESVKFVDSSADGEIILLP
jgi:hypothetical protein